MDNEFLKSLVKELADEYTTVAADGKSSAEFSGTIDTGSYMLNAALSGSIYGGVPNNKITTFAGESATGKTYFVLGVISQFLKANPDGGIIYFDTESAVTNEMLLDRDIDPRKVIKSEPDTIQKFRHNCITMLDNYMEEEGRIPLIIVLDSLGQLSSTKEIEDTAEGSETRDMTKAQILKATFRVLNLKLAKAKVPLLICNHTYDVIGSYYPQKEMSGGSGLKYSASTIAFLSKKKEKDGTEVVGNIIKVKMHKSRLSRENREIEVLLDYTTGLHRYYGLLDLGIKYKIFKKVANRIEIDNKKVYAKTIYDNPDEYFNSTVMEKLENAAKKEYQYGDFDDVVEELVEEDA